jgi:hypothetical protein
MQIIAHNPIPTPLFANTKPNHDENTPLIPWSSPQLTPSRLLSRNLELDGTDDLAVLELYDFVFTVTIGVEGAKDVESGVFAAFGNQPAG